MNRSEEEIISDVRLLLDDAVKPYFFTEDVISILFSMALTELMISEVKEFPEMEGNRIIRFIYTECKTLPTAKLTYNTEELWNPTLLNIGK